MKLHCPHCGVKGSAEDSYSGRKVKCPKCHGVFAVQPDMALDLPVDAGSLSSTPVKSSMPSIQTAMPTVDHERTGDTGTDKALPAEEAEERIMAAEDLTEVEPAAASSEEDILDWEDGTPEIDQQVTEAEEGTQPAGIELADHPEIAETVVLVETDEEGVVEDEVQSVQQSKEIEQEPYGVDQEQCWQCGKKESVGESFIARDGRLYCTACVPAEKPEKTTTVSQDQSTGDPVLKDASTASTASNDKISLGEIIRKAWLKIKNALSS